jgi:uncharacterized protein (DUF1015 family)
MAHLVASRSYVTYTPAALKRKLSENPYSFIHIINPEFKTGEKPRKNSTQRFKQVRKRFEEFLQNNFLQKDESPTFYLYEQSTCESTFTGIIGAVSNDDYKQGRIKKHEQTLTAREKLFCSYLDVCGFNAEPVLLTYRENLASLEALFGSVKLERPEYEFTTTDGATHKMWMITQEKEVQRIQSAFKKVDSLYIADGHHRMASSNLLSEKRGGAETTDSNLYRHTMAMVMHGDQLKIHPFHRLLSKTCTLATEELLQILDAKFFIEKSDQPVFPFEKRKFGLKLKDSWYELRLKEFEGGSKAVHHLDSQILFESVLRPIFGIQDQKTDKRLSFVAGNKDTSEVEKAVDLGRHFALITLASVDPEEVFDISDEGSTMPPKSTYIEPKLRSGLTIMNL